MSESVPSESIRVFLLIENRLLREALVRLLRKRPDLTIVGESGQTDLTIQDILETNCDVLVIGSFQSNWLPPGFTLERVGELGEANSTGRNRRSEEHTSELQSHHDLVCRLLLE